ncbi:chemotaxis protein CheA [Yoonia sp.]|uniref:chemotaxis protein CheA n=1 Tax=Yoonia sp. TaxID=2212373 RepID=UPI0035C7C422
MITDGAILDAFFEECEDLLAALTDGLSDMRGGQTDSETVNAVFRAVPSIKGAAGAFSMDELVGFAHKFETVLDDLRSEKLAADDDLLRVLQRAGDILSNLVDDAQAERPAERDKVDPVLDELQSFLGAEAEAEEDFVFDALSLDFGGPAITATYSVQFTGTAALYASGNDPLMLLRALQEIGPITVSCNRDGLPDSLDTLDVEGGYLQWAVTISDQMNDQRIREAFEFVDDLCDLKICDIEDIEDGLDAEAGETPVGAEDQPDEQISAQTIVSPANATPEAADIAAKPAAKQDRTVKKATGTLRVDPERVDRLINAVGELIINQSVISQRIEEAALPSSSDIFSDLDDYKLLAREIQEGVMAIRAQPVKPLFQRMLRIAREAADTTGKDVEIITEGETTEVDKTVVERLADPLTHMIRNAIDHGIEKSADRKIAGKPPQGTLKLRASQVSGSIVIQIIDDGAGLNRPKIREIAVSKGLIQDNAQLSDAEIDHLLFAPGFSTAAEVTNLSGRGVGMDVVKTAITELGGKIAIGSVTGEGTTFSITLPLTLAVMDGMVINVDEQTMVVPIASILETIRPKAADLAKIGLNNDLLRIRGEYVPIIDLADRLGRSSQPRALTDQVLLLIQSESIAQCALAVDEIFDQRQVVVKSMIGNYGAIPGISGATILGDGKIALIVDADFVATGASAPAPGTTPKEERDHARHS